jgi:hypothetical protein
VLVLGEIPLEPGPVLRGNFAVEVFLAVRQLLPPGANDLGQSAKVDLAVRLAVPASLRSVLVPVISKELPLLLGGPLVLTAVQDPVCESRTASGKQFKTRKDFA